MCARAMFFICRKKINNSSIVTVRGVHLNTARDQRPYRTDCERRFFSTHAVAMAARTG